MAKQITYTVNVDTKQATQGIDNLNESLEEVNSTAEETGNIKDGFNAMPGPIGKAKGAVAALSAGFKALLANPVVLVITGIVATLALLFKAFTSTKEGGEKLSQVMAGLGAVMDVLRDTLVTLSKKLISVFKDPKKALMDFADALKQNIINRFEGMMELIPAIGKAIKLLFKGEFAEAGKVATDAMGKVVLGVENVTDKVGDAINSVGDLVNEAIDEAKLASGAERALQRVADAERALTIERAKQNKVIAESRLIALDESKSLEERIAAVKMASKLEGELAEKELAVQKQRAAAISLRNSLSDSSSAALDEEAAAIARTFQLETASLSKKKKLAMEIEALSNEAFAKEKARLKVIQDAKDKADKADKKRAAEEIKRIDAVKKAEEKAAKEKKRIDEEVAANKLATTFAALSAVQGLVGADSKFGKALGVTSAIIDTYKGATKALGQGGAFGYIGAAAVLATGFANVKKIIGTKEPDAPLGSSGGGGGGSSSAPASIGPSVGIVEAQTNPNSQIVGALGKALKTPPKAFVVGQDMTTQQSLDRHITQNASIGG